MNCFITATYMLILSKLYCGNLDTDYIRRFRTFRTASMTLEWSNEVTLLSSYASRFLRYLAYSVYGSRTGRYLSFLSRSTIRGFSEELYHFGTC